MKVLLIDVNCKHSSTGKIVYDLYTGLNNSGNEAAICYGRGPLVKEKNIYKFGLDIETYFHAGMSRLTGLMGFFSIISTIRLINYIREFKPDVVHIHELHAYFVNYGPVINFLKKNRIKTIWTFHCEFMYTGKCGYTFECEKWKKQCNSCPQLKEYPKSLVFDFSRFMFKYKKNLFEDFNNLTIVTPSQWLADRVKLSFLKETKIEVIHNGVDVEVFYYRDKVKIREDLGIKKKNVVISIAPDILKNPRKGGKWVLEIANLMIEDDVHFVLVGEDNSDIAYRDNVSIISKISDQNNLAEYYSMADLFVICSKIETFSMTSAEALCCGTRVVGFKSGAPETVFREPEAVFIDYGNIDELIKVVKKAVINHSDKKDVSEKMSEFLSNKRMIELYSKVYSKAVSQD